MGASWMSLLPPVGPPVVLTRTDTVVYSFADDGSTMDVAGMLRPQLVGIVLSSALIGVFLMLLVSWLAHSGAGANRVERAFVTLLALGTVGGWIAQLRKAARVFVEDFGASMAAVADADI